MRKEIEEEQKKGKEGLPVTPTVGEENVTKQEEVVEQPAEVTSETSEEPSKKVRFKDEVKE